jgi:hypothetical protein
VRFDAEHGNGQMKAALSTLRGRSTDSNCLLCVNPMALKDLRAQQILLTLAGIGITGCFIRGAVPVREDGKWSR